MEFSRTKTVELIMSKRLLYVEDDVDLQALYKNKLEDAGYEVFLTATAEQAMSYLTDEKVSLVLLDIMLGGKLNGFDLLEWIRSGDKNKSVPVIVLTNLDNQGGVALKIGASEYIVKVNTTPGLVVDRIKKVIG